MTPSEYCAAAMQFERDEYDSVAFRSSQIETLKIEHAAYGLVTEAGEILDALKKHKIYGKPLDLVNLKEEAGDVLWYLARLATAAGFSFEEAMQANIAKLSKRYGEKFSEASALNRDTEAERKVLEQG